MRDIRTDNAIHIRTTETDKYINDIRKYQLLTAEEEPILFKQIRKGDKKAFEKVITSNLRFVVACAKQFVGCGIPLADLIAEGNTGLFKAVEMFDHTKGFKFISYAVGWIQSTIMTAISNHSRMVRFPSNVTNTIKKIKEAASKMEQVDEFLDSEQLAEALDIKPEIVVMVLNETFYASLDKPVSEESDMTFADLLEADDYTDKELDDESIKNTVTILLKGLEPKESDILKRFYGLAPYFNEQSIETIAEAYKCSDVTVRYAITRAIKKIQKKIKHYEKCI